MPPGKRNRGRQGGFTYLGLLALIVLIGLFLAAAGEVTRTAARRERETELLFIGHQYRDAIARFYQQNHRFPLSLAELVGTGTEGPLPARFLRRIYPDPMTRSTDWVLLPAPDGGISGVASASAEEPMKKAHFDDGDAGFVEATKYTEWAFLYDPRAPVRAPGTPVSRPPPPPNG